MTLGFMMTRTSLLGGWDAVFGSPHLLWGFVQFCLETLPQCSTFELLDACLHVNNS